jgi:hypothetical protein
MKLLYVRNQTKPKVASQTCALLAERSEEYYLYDRSRLEKARRVGNGVRRKRSRKLRHRSPRSTPLLVSMHGPGPSSPSPSAWMMHLAICRSAGSQRRAPAARFAPRRPAPMMGPRAAPMRRPAETCHLEMPCTQLDRSPPAPYVLRRFACALVPRGRGRTWCASAHRLHGTRQARPPTDHARWAPPPRPADIRKQGPKTNPSCQTTCMQAACDAHAPHSASSSSPCFTYCTHDYISTKRQRGTRTRPEWQGRPTAVSAQSFPAALFFLPLFSFLFQVFDFADQLTNDPAYA